MSEIDILKSNLSKQIRQLENALAERQNFLNQAAAIKAVYQRLSADKDAVIGYRDSVKSLKKEDFKTFKGNLYKNVYLKKMDELLSEYDCLINRIDANMDALNMEIAKYENKANEMFGIIGTISSGINTLEHTIQNWIN